MRSTLYVRCDMWNKPLWFWVLQNHIKPLFSISGAHGYSSKKCAVRAAFTALSKIGGGLRVDSVKEIK